jgi:CDP-paratose 2-epimerase
VSTAIVTGSAGLVGSEAVRRLHASGWDVVGIDNDMRGVFFGQEASTRWMADSLRRELRNYRHHPIDVRDAQAVNVIVREVSSGLALVIHTAAQPSHDWAGREPVTDFEVNALGTLILLEAVRQHAPGATFIFTSTNKVYGDAPNRLPLLEHETRYELPTGHPWHGGIPEEMTIDQSTHSLFGVSKAAADLLVQEYGRYYGMRTVTFRGGCLTGPAHSGAELHGFLAYLMKCVTTGHPYKVYGYKGKQVRDNIHNGDLMSAFECVIADPEPGSVYNIGGGRESNCSVLEAIALAQEIAGCRLKWSYVDHPRLGDHQWWISDLGSFRSRYPAWRLTHGIESILREIYESNRRRWCA